MRPVGKRHLAALRWNESADALTYADGGVRRAADGDDDFLSLAELAAFDADGLIRMPDGNLQHWQPGSVSTRSMPKSAPRSARVSITDGGTKWA